MIEHVAGKIEHFIEAQDQVDSLPFLARDAASLKTIKACVLRQAEHAGLSLPAKKGVGQIDTLRLFGALCLVQKPDSYQFLSSAPDALSETDRQNAALVFQMAFCRERGGVLCYHRAVLMHLVYRAFGYEALVYSMGCGPQKGPYNHSVNIVREPQSGRWHVQDSHLGCRFSKKNGQPLEFIEQVELLAGFSGTVDFPVETCFDVSGTLSPAVHLINEEGMLGHRYRQFLSAETAQAFSLFFAPLGLSAHWENIYLFPKRLMGHSLSADFVKKVANILAENQRSASLENDWRKQQKKRAQA